MLIRLSKRMQSALDRVNRAPRWMLWAQAIFLISSVLAGIYYLTPHLKPLALSRELVVGIRETPTSFTRESTTDEKGKTVTLESGFDHDLVLAFANSLGKSVRFVVAKSESDLHRQLERGDIHMAAAWLSRNFVEAPSNRNMTGADDEQMPQSTLLKASKAYAKESLILVQSDDVMPIDSIAQLNNLTIHAVDSNAHEAWKKQLAKQKLSPRINTPAGLSEFDLLKGVSARKIQYAVVPKSVARIGLNYFEGIEATLNLGAEEDIVWAFPKRSGDILVQEANHFLTEAEKNGTLRQLRDRYFGAVDRLQVTDRSAFLSHIRTRLPKYQAQFKRAQLSSGYDWRLLAALAYQESKWDIKATSPTGVRGLMMLTGDTADRLGVRNRLDPFESIMGGASYLDQLRNEIPDSVPEPDRTWMAIASYNVGPAQILSARKLAKSAGLNPNSWVDIKRTLPQLGQTKSGTKIRGGEAVVTAENVRMYHAILSRTYPATVPFSLTPQTHTYGISAPEGKAPSRGSGLR